PTLLNVRGVDRQNVSVIVSGRETHPSMRRVIRRMRTVVHPDGPILFVGAGVLVDGDQFLGLRIALLPDAELQGAAINIGSGVHLALVFRKRETVRVPAQGPLASFRVDG